MGSAVIFRILGPLTVDGAPSLGGPKQRALLALLVARAGEPVPADVLVEEVWGDAAPATAGHAVQVYISQLRKLVAPAGAAIESDAGGYRLAAGSDDIDAEVFKRRCEDGRRALGAGDSEQALAFFDAALDLWRGPAFSDLRFEPWAQAEAGRLEELRLGLIEDRADALLALGRHAALVPQLEHVVEAEPLRERVRAQLMLALYRSGRQADALAVYRAGARIMRDELGLDPGSALRELEAAILAQDPRLLAAGARVSLPAPATALVGRETEVDDVVALVRGATRIVTLTGAGGIGKTRIAIEAATRVAPMFPGGVFFVALASVARTDLVGGAIADALEVPHAEADPVAAVSTEIHDERTLVVVDNFEHLVDAAPELGRLVSSSRGVKLLVTSRRSLRLYGEHELQVPPLEEADGVALFRARGAARGGVDATDEQIAEICHRLDGLPLAIELAAAQSGVLTPEEMLSGLASGLELATEGPRDVHERQQTLRATIEWSHNLLEEASAEVFHRLGVFAGGWDAEAAHAVAGAGRAELAQLIEHSLIAREPTGGRFRMLATIREYALERLAESGAEQEVRGRHAEHFVAVAENGDAMLRTQGGQVEALNRLEREHNNLRAALTWSRSHDPALHLRLAGALGSFMAVRGHYVEARAELEAALAAVPEEDHVDRSALARALTSAGLILRTQVEHASARTLLERGAQLYRELGDPSGLVRALTNLGFTEYGLGDSAAAARNYEEALTAARESGNDRDRLVVLNCLADLDLREGRFEQVDKLAEEALSIAERLEDPETIAVALMNRAHAAFGAGRTDELLMAGIGSLQAWVTIGDQTSAAWSLDVVAAAAAAIAPESAARLLAAAAAVRERAGIRLDAFEQSVHDDALREARAQLPDDDFERAQREGAAMEFDAVVAEALALGATAS
jgi:predicted ATPase/DNA-binding SARP family transcriptional activator